MTLFKIFLFALVLHLFIYCCSAQCTYIASDGSTYDLSSLTKNTDGSYYYFFDGTTNYTFNICGEVTGGMMGPAPYCLTGSSVCQGEHGSYVSSGMASNTSFEDNPLGANQGVTVLYGSGTPCRFAIRETRLRMTCVPGAGNLVVKSVTQPSTCSYLVEIESSVSCPGGPTPTTGDATTGDATTGDATTGDATTGDATTGDATTGDATTGDATTGDATTGDATTSDVTSTTTSATTGDVTSTNSDTTTTISSTSSSDTTTTISSTSGDISSGTTSGGATTDADSTAPSTSTTHDSSDTPVHHTPVGKWLIALVVGLGVFVIIISVLLAREFIRRRRAQDDTQMERLRLTGSTYEDVKKRYLK